MEGIYKMTDELTITSIADANIDIKAASDTLFLVIIVLDIDLRLMICGVLNIV